MQGVYYIPQVYIGVFLSILSKGFMVTINADAHPGLHRYSLELAKYPELTEEQYNSVLSDLKQPEESVLYQNARETLICSHLAT